VPSLVLNISRYWYCKLRCNSSEICMMCQIWNWLEKVLHWLMFYLVLFSASKKVSYFHVGYRFHTNLFLSLKLFV